MLEQEQAKQQYLSEQIAEQEKRLEAVVEKLRTYITAQRLHMLAFAVATQWRAHTLRQRERKRRADVLYQFRLCSSVMSVIRVFTNKRLLLRMAYKEWKEKRMMEAYTLWRSKFMKVRNVVTQHITKRRSEKVVDNADDFYTKRLKIDVWVTWLGMLGWVRPRLSRAKRRAEVSVTEHITNKVKQGEDGEGEDDISPDSNRLEGEEEESDGCKGMGMKIGYINPEGKFVSYSDHVRMAGMNINKMNINNSTSNSLIISSNNSSNSNPNDMIPSLPPDVLPSVQSSFISLVIANAFTCGVKRVSYAINQVESLTKQRRMKDALGVWRYALGKIRPHWNRACQGSCPHIITIPSSNVITTRKRGEGEGDGRTEESPPLPSSSRHFLRHMHSTSININDNTDPEVADVITSIFHSIEQLSLHPHRSPYDDGDGDVSKLGREEDKRRLALAMMMERRVLLYRILRAMKMEVIIGQKSPTLRRRRIVRSAIDRWLNFTIKSMNVRRLIKVRENKTVRTLLYAWVTLLRHHQAVRAASFKEWQVVQRKHEMAVATFESIKLKVCLLHHAYSSYLYLFTLYYIFIISFVIYFIHIHYYIYHFFILTSLCLSPSLPNV